VFLSAYIIVVYVTACLLSNEQGRGRKEVASHKITAC